MFLPSGALLTIGGFDDKENIVLNEISRLANDKWHFIGYLIKV